MDENIILSAKGLDLWYGPTQALKGVSMDIPEKQGDRPSSAPPAAASLPFSRHWTA